MVQHRLLKEFEHYLLKNFVSGDRLPGEVELAQHFQVSRATIREIMIHLSFLGVLERTAKRGTFVKIPEAQEIGETLGFQLQASGYGFEEMKQTRLFLEISQAEMLIHKMTPVDFDKLEALTAMMEKSVSQPGKADRLDLEFHLALMKVTGNRILTIFSQVMLLMFEKKYRQKFLNAPAAMKSVRDHRNMLNAIRSGELQKLKVLIKKHIQPL
ncbi:MAG: HTH-type transcriptional regulator LutR [Lentisphaerae bacterium ADurb.Bin242]|nr:MAG: HTH-type transcriptional regulator LutR [Lentisphaerae bacterium ADurb.Bin242]